MMSIKHFLRDKLESLFQQATFLKDGIAESEKSIQNNAISMSHF